MRPPDRLPMRAVLFADGARGSAMQQHRNEEHGINVSASRESRNAAFVETWTADRLPGQAFETYAELQDAIEKAGL